MAERLHRLRELQARPLRNSLCALLDARRALELPATRPVQATQGPATPAAPPDRVPTAVGAGLGCNWGADLEPVSAWLVYRPWNRIAVHTGGYRADQDRAIALEQARRDLADVGA